MKTPKDFPNLFIIDHPIVQHNLTHMRDRKATTRQFRRLLKELSMLMGYELTRGLPMTQKDIETPLAKMKAPVLDGKKLAIVPILRAGLGMADGLLELVPSARVGQAFTAITSPKSPSNTSSSCRRRKTAFSSLSIPCSRRGIRQCTRWRSSSSMACRLTKSASWRWLQRRKG